MGAPPVGPTPPEARPRGQRRPPAAAWPSPCSLGALSRNDTEDVAGRLPPRLTAAGGRGGGGKRQGMRSGCCKTGQTWTIKVKGKQGAREETELGT